MNKLYTLLVALLFSLSSSAQVNIAFRSHLAYPGTDLSNIGGYVDSSGNEYALVGYELGLSIVNVTNPDSPYVAFDVPGWQSIWREVKTWQNYAYVTTEAGNGLQIVNLGYLPDSVQVKQWYGDSAINNQLNTIHSLHIDKGYVYLHGSNLFSGATVIASLSDPWNPHFMSSTPTTYVHDGYVRNDTLWAAHIYDGYFTAIDVHDKHNPLVVGAQNTPSNFTHNTWLNDAGSVLFTTDEVGYSYLTSYDVHDVNNIQELDRVQVTPGSGSIVHNTHTLNDYEVVSWYKDGIAIVDASHPDNLIVTGWYDTDTLESGDGFNGAWGVYPYLPSGNLVVSDISGGLYVLTPTYVRGCYLEGMVTDSVTQQPLIGATIQILNTTVIEQNKINGEYKTGVAQSGIYAVKFSKPGYKTKIVYGVSLQNGVLTIQDAALEPLVPFTLQGHVSEAVTNLPIANASVVLKNDQYNFTATTNATGDFTVNNCYEDVYDFSAGKWGHVTYCVQAQSVTAANTLQAVMAKGYSDDFSFNFGWVASGNLTTGWERGVPVGTTYNSVQSAPGADVTTDCGDMAFVTDNQGGSALASDVDGNAAILTSPAFDLTGMTNPAIHLDYWYFDVATSFGAPNDTLFIRLNNGTSTATVDMIAPSTPGAGTWVSRSYTVSNFITPTSNMKLLLSISDTPPIYNLTEAGIDNFSVSEATGIDQHFTGTATFSAYPNPFEGAITLRYQVEGTANIVLCDLTGRTMETITGISGNGAVAVAGNYPTGVYLARLTREDGSQQVIRLTKTK